MMGANVPGAFKETSKQSLYMYKLFSAWSTEFYSYISKSLSSLKAIQDRYRNGPEFFYIKWLNSFKWLAYRRIMVAAERLLETVHFLATCDIKRRLSLQRALSSNVPASQMRFFVFNFITLRLISRILWNFWCFLAPHLTLVI